MDIKNYCVLPFNSVSIAASGEIRHCCNGGHNLVGTHLVDNLSVNELINNEFIHDIRDAFLKDEKHPKCARCWKMEDMGILSFREVANRYKNYAINETGIRTFKRDLNFEDIEYFVVARTIKEKYLNEILAAGKKTFMFGLDRKLGIDEQYFLCNSENYNYGVYIDKTNLEEINCNVP